MLLLLGCAVWMSASEARAIPLTYTLDDTAPVFLVDGANAGIAAAGFVLDIEEARLDALAVVSSTEGISLQLLNAAPLVSDGAGGFQVVGAAAIFLHPALDPAGELVSLDAFISPAGSQFTFNFFGLPTGVAGPPDVTALAFNASLGGELPSVGPMNPVPEPRSAAAYLVGLAVVGWAIRRRGIQIVRERAC